MIFYHPHYDLRFSNYGIEIPIHDDRALKVFTFMKKMNPSLKWTRVNKKDAITKKDLLLVHEKLFVQKLFSSYRKLESQMLTAFELVTAEGEYFRYNPKNATLDFQHALDVILKQTALGLRASKFALKNGFSFTLHGGMHHAMSFGGRGFCLINDLVIIIKKMQQEKLIKTAWVVDVDAHKGDGTAELTQNDSSIKTLSLHMKKSWPLDSGDGTEPWFLPSSLDIAFSKGEEKKYNQKLKAALALMEKRYELPDIVLVVNGADPYVFDELSSTKELQLTKKQLLERDKILYQFFKERHIPQSYFIAGGYGKRSWEIYAQFLKFVWQDSSKRPKVSSR